MANRIQKLMEQTNLKLGSVESNTLGVSGRTMLEAITAGQDSPEELAQLARGKLKNKIPQLVQALEGRVRPHHRFLLAEFLEEWGWFERRIVLWRRRLTNRSALLSRQSLCGKRCQAWTM